MSLLQKRLAKAPLSMLERETLQSYEDNPNSRSFLAVAEIMARHGFSDDSMELLIHGVQKHPSYTAGRVALALRLYKNSTFRQAWDLLESSPVSLKENKTAQNLRFRLAILLGLEDRLIYLRQQMESRGQLDEELAPLLADWDEMGFAAFRQLVIQQAREEGYQLDSIDIQDLSDPISPLDGDDSIQESDEGTGKEVIEDDPVHLEQLMDGYYVSPLQEIFSSSPKSDNSLDDGMDAPSLAAIYRKQGRYQKSLEIYQRLLYLSPGNDGYKRQVEELRALEAEQVEREKEIDPDLVEQLDQLQIIESKIRYLTRLLERLDQYEA